MPYGDTGAIRKIYRGPLFDRALVSLRSEGGYGTVAAGKAEAFIAGLCGGAGARDRERFRFTRNGEYRIRNCRKVDLGCGYRIVCIQKDRRLALLYIGTHDDCFRWIERHCPAEFDLNSVPDEAWTAVAAAHPKEAETGPSCGDDRLAKEHEEALLSRIDDAVLRKVFAGIVTGRT